MARLPAFIGRTAELDRLQAAVATAAAGRGGLTVVVGEAGVGKSRLIDEVVANVGGAVTVVRGRADEHDPSAFGLWMSVLHQLDLPRPGTDPSVPATDVRWETVDLLHSALAAATPALVVLDDLHWADDHALWVLEHLLDRMTDRGLAVVAATRGGADVRAARWPALYRRADVIALDGLDAREVAELAGQLGMAAAEGASLWQRTGGNPLFVREQLHAGRGSMPTTIEDLLSSSVERLGTDVADALSLVAVAGPTAPIDVVAAAGTSTAEQFGTLLEIARRHDVLRDGEDGLRFRHDLLAEAAIRRLGGERLQQVHAALAEAWRSRRGRAAITHRARHLIQAVPVVDAAVAVDAALDAAAELRRLGQHAEAAGLLQSAATALDSRADIGRAAMARIHLAEAEARWALDDHDGAMAACDGALRAADAAGVTALVAAAEVAALTHHNPFQPDPVRVARLAELDARLDGDEAVDPALRIRLRGRRAVLAMSLPERIDEAIALGDDALRRARTLGDPDVLVRALSDRYFVLPTPADYEAKAAAAAEVLAIARTTGRPELAVMGHEWVYAGLMARGDLHLAIAELDQLDLLAAVLPSPYWRYATSVRRSGLLALLGDYEGAIDLASASRTLAAGVVPEPEAIGLDAGLRLTAGLLYGRTDHGAAAMHQALIDALGSVPVLFLQARYALGEAILGDPVAARLRVAPWLDRFASALATPEGLPTISVLAHVAVITEWVEAAEALRPLLAPFAGMLPVGNGAAVDVTVDHHLAALALVAGDTAGAVASAARALHLARSMRSPVLEARALALVSGSANLAGDTAAAASAGDAAASIAEPLGAQLDPSWMRRARVPPRREESASPRDVRLRLDRGRWFVESPFGDAHVAASVGIDQIARLVTSPGVQIPAVELATPGSARDLPVASDLGPALDARAKREYRQRIVELQADIDEADADHDVERAARHRLEMEAILDELRAAVGLGGRDRPQGSGSERARVNTARTVRRGIAAFSAALPDLGAHLEVSIRTGHHCAYAPEPAAALTWHVVR